MRSPVNWALLGLVIERPSYAYDLAQRFERRYGEVLTLSNVGHVYTALGALESRTLVEEIPGTREGRQPRPRYRATPAGEAAYRQWLVAQAAEDRKRSQMFVLALAALAGDPRQAIAVLEGYEREWLTEGMGTPIAREQEDLPVDGPAALLRRLREEEQRLAVGGKLEWVQFARQELARLQERARRR